MALAPSALASWMPEMETDEAPACHRTVLPDWNSPIRKRACEAVIQVLGGWLARTVNDCFFSSFVRCLLLEHRLLAPMTTPTACAPASWSRRQCTLRTHLSICQYQIAISELPFPLSETPVPGGN